MSKFFPPTINPETESEAYFVAQALAYYRDMKKIAQNAPFGQFLNYAEAVALSQGRELIRTSLETIVQEEVSNIEKKNETALCPNCQEKKRNRGGRTKQIVAAVGTIAVERRYDECSPCHHSEYVVDALLGLENRYTIGLRSFATYAGTGKSFAEAQKDLHKYLGLKISHMTIRDLCDKEAVKMKEWQETSSEIQKDFMAARGVVEVTMDAAKVNTTEGWKDAKVGIISKREFGESALPEEWETRKLPRPSIRVAFAAIEGKEFFQQRVNDWRRRLRLGANGDISVLGDGADWIWNISKAVFGNVRENLDVFHGLEHLSDAGKVLYGDDTDAYKEWQEGTKWEFLREGFTLIEQRLDVLDQQEWELREREELRKLRGYLAGQSGRLNYAERLLEGRAIGSGQVEGACKSMIGKRLKQTGAKWLVPRLNRMTMLCAIRYRDQWEQYWNYAN